MGNPKATSFPPSPSPPSSSSNLPPGCRFYPSEEQLLCYYLHHKNYTLTPNSNPSSLTPNLIKEINLFNYNPFDLPEPTCFRFGYKGRKRHWYCYCEKRDGDGDGPWRTAFGFWKLKGRPRDVVGRPNGGGNVVVVGTRKRFVFYLDHNKKRNGHAGGGQRQAVRTRWIMYEYSLIDDDHHLKKASFVVCRIFVKSPHRTSISEQALSSCAEESIATVRHVGIQHDENIVSVMDEERKHVHDSVNEKAEAAGMSTQLIEDIQTENPVRSPGHAACTNMLVHPVTATDLMSILEGHYIELDDFV